MKKVLPILLMVLLPGAVFAAGAKTAGRISIVDDAIAPAGSVNRMEGMLLNIPITPFLRGLFLRAPDGFYAPQKRSHKCDPCGGIGILLVAALPWAWPANYSGWHNTGV